VRGGAVALLAQGLAFVLQTGSTVVLARLLSPEDFGLQGMVVVMTGFLGLFRDAGLSVASVQREVLTHEQTSTLFWINVAVGAFLTIAAASMGPLLVGFYHEPRLLSIAIASAAAFLFNSLAVQHRALLNRAMRFVTIAKIDDGILVLVEPLRKAAAFFWRQSQQSVLNLFETHGRNLVFPAAIAKENIHTRELDSSGESPGNPTYNKNSTDD